jgi:NDP-sugar pyrophosphorylase family protein
MKVKSAGLLAAGIANRMNEGYFPKSLIPVGNLSPILYHLFNLKKIGINNVVIVINKKSSILREYLGNGNQFSMKIDYIEDDEKLDTGGDLKQLLSKINEDFLLISCDTIIEVDYSILIDKFKQDSFLLFKKESNGKYFFGQNNKLYNASNTTNENERVSFAGIGVFQRKSLDEYFPEGKNNFPLSYVLKELAGKGKLFGQTTTSPIFNLNSYDNFCQANDYFLQRENLIEKFCFSQKIKTIIFDLDFTLFDSSDIVVDGINYSCEKLNIAKLSRKEIYENTKFKFPRNEVIKLGKSLTSDINKQQQFCDYYYEYIKDKYPKLYPSALELLYFLNSQKLTLGIITSKTRSLCIDTL